MRNRVRGRNSKKKNFKVNKIWIIVIVVLLLIILGVFAFLSIKNKKKIKEAEQNQEHLEEVQKIQEKEEIKFSKTKGDKFVKIDDTIAYIDSLNGNYLYIFNLKDSTGIKVNTPKELNKIYFDGKYIYGMPHHYQGKGIYRIDLEGNVTQIYEGEVIQLWLTDDKIYFVQQDGFDEINQIPEGDLCIMDKDGKNITTVIQNTRNYFKIQNDKIYYSDRETKGLYSADLNGENKKELAQGRITITSITDKYIIYVDFAEQETYHVLYLDDNTNHKIGRFGSSFVSGEQGYLLTRKFLDGNETKNLANQIDIEDKFSIFKIDVENKKEEQVFKSDMGIPFLIYAYKDKVYLREQGVVRVDFEKQSVEENIPSGYYIDGYCYQFKTDNSKVSEISIYNLETLGEQKVIPAYDGIAEQNYDVSNSGNVNNTANSTVTNTISFNNNQNSNISTQNNANSNSKKAISEGKAIQIWEKERKNFGKNNNIIDYENYKILLSSEKTTGRANSLFTQKDNAPVISDGPAREIWKLVTSDSKDGLQILEVYIDCYTGKVIGGWITGD